MLEPVHVYGEYENISGIIVSVNFSESGFVYNSGCSSDGSFGDVNPDNIGFNMTLEIADIEKDDVSYIPMKTNKTIAHNKNEMKNVYPIVKSSVSTKTVVLNHEQLEADGITNLYNLINVTWEGLDSGYAKVHLWDEIKGKEIKVKGVNFNDILIASSININMENVDISKADFDFINSARDVIQTKLNNKPRLYTNRDTIMNILYECDDSVPYTRGKIEVDESNNWNIIDEKHGYDT